MSESKILVFVYGTLKKGEPNYKTLTDTEGSQRFVSSGTTIEKFPLVIGTQYNIPFLLSNPGQGNNIEGEVYEIDEKKLEALDELEAYPTLYDRILVQIKLSSDESTIDAYIYLLKNWRPDLLETSTPMLTSYSSLGSHGRPYVDRYVRAIEMLDGDGPSIYEEILGKTLAITILDTLSRKKAEYDLRTTSCVENN